MSEFTAPRVFKDDTPRSNPAAIQRELEEEGLSFYRWGNPAGFEYAAHRHGYHKIIVVQSGSITFHLPQTERTFKLEPGDRLELPAGTLHAARVGPQGVACLEAHIQ